MKFRNFFKRLFGRNIKERITDSLIDRVMIVINNEINDFIDKYGDYNKKQLKDISKKRIEKIRNKLDKMI